MGPMYFYQPLGERWNTPGNCSCPNCGAPLKVNEQDCGYCKSPNQYYRPSTTAPKDSSK